MKYKHMAFLDTVIPEGFHTSLSKLSSNAPFAMGLSNGQMVKIPAPSIMRADTLEWILTRSELHADPSQFGKFL
jgi:hypothetical protein